MMSDTSRRDLLRVAGGALLVGAASACAGGAQRATTPGAGAGTSGPEDARGFLMFQLTDTHWGYKGPANPDPGGAFERAVTDAAERKTRLETAKAMLAKLGTELLVIPGEHDAGADHGEAFRAVFGATHQARELKGVYLIALDNVSDPKGGIGDEQLAWFEKEVAKVPADRPLLVFTHRPLFQLAEPWDWYTKDGDKALAILDKHPGTTVFYGHIHQALIHKTNATLHVSTRSLVFPLPAPMSQPARAPLAWDGNAVDHGLGYRGIAIEGLQPTWVERALVG
jgi:3',5'-cyclic AMP phosphodiesterase CpdA